jgi:hypothetical protein
MLLLLSQQNVNHGINIVNRNFGFCIKLSKDEISIQMGEFNSPLQKTLFAGTAFETFTFSLPRVKNDTNVLQFCTYMDKLNIKIINQDALAILNGMEQAGLISLPKKETKHLNLSMKLRGTISSSRAQEMIEVIDEEREEWERRY